MPVLLTIYQALRERCANQEIIFGGDRLVVILSLK